MLFNPQRMTNQGMENQRMTNRGTGAGGAKTNLHGKAFESKTEHLTGFIQKRIGYEKDNIILLRQGELKQYFRKTFQKELIRHPDEAYLIRQGDQYTLKILEKKNQNVEGSVIEKLGLGAFYKEEYQSCLGPMFKVEYAYCLSSFLKQKYLSNTLKYNFLRDYNERNQIQVLFGDDEDYPEKLNDWLIGVAHKGSAP
jgi:hypothetical protein